MLFKSNWTVINKLKNYHHSGGTGYNFEVSFF